MNSKVFIEKSSFRDPSGVLYYIENKVYRQVNKIYKENFDLFLSTGLARKLVREKLILPFRKANRARLLSKDAYKVIESAKVSFISYPYEWSFSQLKDAALLTLKIQKIALELGMTLKDASAYNVQFNLGRPVFIDTLSFEKYEEGKPWIAYRQFCQHFLAPLSLMLYTDVRLSQFLRIYIDGVPLDLASRLLPKKTLLRLGLFSHLHLHAKAQQRYADRAQKSSEKRMKLNKVALLGIINNLEATIEKMNLPKQKTQWGEYYTFTNYSKKAFAQKKKLVSSFLNKVRPKNAWDLGANTGEFSRLASDKRIFTVAFDMDPEAVEQNYLQVKRKKETNLFPLLSDLTNPSSGLGWAGEERKSLTERGPADVILALALVHHLAISNNLPFSPIASFFSQNCTHLIIEFIPKDDSQTQKLLTTREDIFPDYNQETFERAFSRYFVIKESQKIKGTKRTLYLMKKRWQTLLEK